jgi:hypothetical protein
VLNSPTECELRDPMASVPPRPEGAHVTRQGRSARKEERKSEDTAEGVHNDGHLVGRTGAFARDEEGQRLSHRVSMDGHARESGPGIK